MNASPTAVYVDHTGKIPAAPLVSRLPSSDPGKLVAILAAIGLDVRRAAKPPGQLVARTTRAAWAILAETPPVETRDEKLHFLVADINAAFQRVVAAGATVVVEPQETPAGIRAVVLDPDRRHLLLTSVRAAASPRPNPANPQTAAVDDRPLKELSDAERAAFAAATARSRHILMAAVLLTLLATILLLIVSVTSALRALSGKHAPDDFDTFCTFAAALMLLIAKLICLCDRAKLAELPGTAALTAGLMVDAAIGVAFFFMADGERRFAPLAAEIALMISLALFAYYWSHAAKALRLRITRTLCLFAAGGWVADAVLYLLLLFLLISSSGTASSRSIIGALAIGLGLVQLVAVLAWLAGLTGMMFGMLDPMKPRTPRPA
jgi:hypothetical protein